MPKGAWGALTGLTSKQGIRTMSGQWRLEEALLYAFDQLDDGEELRPQPWAARRRSILQRFAFQDHSPDRVVLVADSLGQLMRDHRQHGLAACVGGTTDRSDRLLLYKPDSQRDG
jgi:hypothetical protein